eukprot:scaffold549_cov174-Ochromonas_danica.AAC.17
MPRYGIRSNSSTSLSSATGGGSVGAERRRRPSSIALSSYAHHSKPILDIDVEGIKRICMRKFKVAVADTFMFLPKLHSTSDDCIYAFPFKTLSSMMSDHSRVVVIYDSKQHEAFRPYSEVHPLHDIRFYAGAAIFCGGVKVGSLCLADIQTRSMETFGEKEKELLLDLAVTISTLLDERSKRILDEQASLAKLVVGVNYRLQEPTRALICVKNDLIQEVQLCLANASRSCSSLSSSKEVIIQHCGQSLALFNHHVKALHQEVEHSLQTAVAYVYAFQPCAYVFKESDLDYRSGQQLLSSLRKTIDKRRPFSLSYSHSTTLREKEVSIQNPATLNTVIDTMLSVQKYLPSLEEHGNHHRATTVRVHLSIQPYGTNKPESSSLKEEDEESSKKKSERNGQGCLQISLKTIHHSMFYAQDEVVLTAAANTARAVTRSLSTLSQHQSVGGGADCEGAVGSVYSFIRGDRNSGRILPCTSSSITSAATCSFLSSLPVRREFSFIHPDLAQQCAATICRDILAAEEGLLNLESEDILTFSLPCFFRTLSYRQEINAKQRQSSSLGMGASSSSFLPWRQDSSDDLLMMDRSCGGLHGGESGGLIEEITKSYNHSREQTYRQRPATYVSSYPMVDEEQGGAGSSRRETAVLRLTDKKLSLRGRRTSSKRNSNCEGSPTSASSSRKFGVIQEGRNRLISFFGGGSPRSAEPLMNSRAGSGKAQPRKPSNGFWLPRWWKMIWCGNGNHGVPRKASRHSVTPTDSC